VSNADSMPLPRRDCGGPQVSPRVRRPAGLALIAGILLLAFGLGTAVSAAYEAFEDMQGRGEMDPTW
jgi:hypothetical protein